MQDPNEPPKILVDDDWKAQAQAEKDKLAAKAEETPAGAASEAGGQIPGGQMPPANFDSGGELLVKTSWMYPQSALASHAVIASDLLWDADVRKTPK